MKILKLSSRASAKNKPYNNMRYLTYLQYTDLTRENINLTSQAISLEQKPRNKIKQFTKLGKPSKQFLLFSFPYFLENLLSQLGLPSYDSYYFYFMFLPFSVLF